MNRPLRRLAALLSAMLLLLSGAGDAFGAHACPHHAAIGAPGHAAAQGMEHAPADAHHPQHAVPGSAAHAEQAEQAGHDGHESCTCGGICPVSTGPVPLPMPGLVHLPLALPYAAPAAHPDPTGLPSRLTPYLLPFAQAPPSPA